MKQVYALIVEGVEYGYSDTLIALLLQIAYPQVFLASLGPKLCHEAALKWVREVREQV